MNELSRMDSARTLVVTPNIATTDAAILTDDGTLYAAATQIHLPRDVQPSPRGR